MIRKGDLQHSDFTIMSTVHRKAVLKLSAVQSTELPPLDTLMHAVLVRGSAILANSEPILPLQLSTAIAVAMDNKNPSGSIDLAAYRESRTWRSQSPDISNTC